MKSYCVLVCLILQNASAFTQVPTGKRTCTRLSSQGRSSFIPDLSDIAKPLEGFFGRSNPSSPIESPVSFEPTPEGLVAQAKRVLNSDLGLQDQSLLDDENFQWVSPTVDKPLDKTDYLAAGRFFDLRAAFPDLNYRAHDFRIDPDDDRTVRFTCRVTGTMRGALRLRDVILSPTGKTMQCPPEGFSMTFDLETGKLVKLCTGFTMDRLVGNTEGTTGVVAAAIVGGQPISDWEIYPPATVLKRFFGRPVKPLPEVSSFLAPFPETVMIQLAKGIVSSNMASVDPSLLAESFTYMTPSLGPIGKKDFLEKYASEEFQDVDPRVSNYRVDPYDPERVWVDLKPVGAGYEGAPQAMSFTFDADGFCTRVTAGAVLDPTVGNGGGLGGPEGLRYARGQASNPLTTRPLPRFLARLKNDALSPLSGVSQSVSSPKTLSSPSAPQPPPSKPTPPQNAPQPVSSKPQEKQLTPLEKLTASVGGGSINLANLAEEKKPPFPVNKSLSVKSPPVIPLKSPPLNKPPSTPPPVPKSATGSWPTKSLTLPLGSINIRTPPIPSTPSRGASSISKAAADKAADTRQKMEQKRKEATEAAKRQAQAKATKEAEATRKKEAARKEETAQKEMQSKKAEAKRIEAAKKAAEAKAKLEQARREKEAARERLVAENRAKKEETAKKALGQKKKVEELQQKKVAAAKEIEQKRQQEDALASLSKAASRATISLFGRQETLEATTRREQQASKIAQSDKQRRDAAKEQQQREEAALATLAKAASRATINLLGLTDFDKEGSSPRSQVTKSPTASPTIPVPRSKAPVGVPTLSRWRKNPDGSVTGNVSGSSNFTNGEKITTSKIVKGSFASGEIVVTGSGSRYFLK